MRARCYWLPAILGYNPLETTPPGDNPLPKIHQEITPPRLGVLTLTDPGRVVLILTLTLTDQRGGELSENWD